MIDCVMVDVLLPANITAISIVPSVTTCIEPCSMTVDVVWENTGDIEGTFEPVITVDGMRIALPLETLGPGLTVEKTFTVAGLTRHTYTICPDPN